MASPPSFKPADTTETPVRLGRLEAWALQHTEFTRQHLDDYRDLVDRVSRLETWKQEALIAIGSMKLRIGWVMFLVSVVSGIMSAVITVGVVKALGLG